MERGKERPRRVHLFPFLRILHLHMKELDLVHNQAHLFACDIQKGGSLKRRRIKQSGSRSKTAKANQIQLQMPEEQNQKARDNGMLAFRNVCWRITHLLRRKKVLTYNE